MPQNFIKMFNSIKQIEQSIIEYLNDIRKVEHNYILVVLTTSGERYLVARMSLDNCVIDEHFVFIAYYKEKDKPDATTKTFGVAIPLSCYAGIEIHTEISKIDLKDHDKLNTKIGFINK